MTTELLTVVEIASFSRNAAKLWTDIERSDFVQYIAGNPDAGDVIPDTGGLRKIRWGRQGSGKRGGVRVIYYYYNLSIPLYLLSVYAKAGKEDIDADEKKVLTAIASELKQQATSKGDPK